MSALILKLWHPQWCPQITSRSLICCSPDMLLNGWQNNWRGEGLWSWINWEKREIRTTESLTIDAACKAVFYLIIIICPLTTEVIGAPQMILKPVFSVFLCSPLPSGTWRTPGLSIPLCLPTSSSVCLVFLPLSLCLARGLWPDLMNGRHVHTTAVCISLRWSGGLCVVRLPAGSWHRLPRW